MAGGPPMTVIGNLVADPELRFTASGQPFATCRITSPPHIMGRQTNEQGTETASSSPV